MVWFSKTYRGILLNEESGWKKKKSKKVGGTLLVYSVLNITYNIYNTNNNTIYRRNNLTTAETSKR